jgi:hypothetical protein
LSSNLFGEQHIQSVQIPCGIVDSLEDHHPGWFPVCPQMQNNIQKRLFRNRSQRLLVENEEFPSEMNASVNAICSINDVFQVTIQRPKTSEICHMIDCVDLSSDLCDTQKQKMDDAIWREDLRKYKKDKKLKLDKDVADHSIDEPLFPRQEKKFDMLSLTFSKSFASLNSVQCCAFCQCESCYLERINIAEDNRRRDMTLCKEREARWFAEKEVLKLQSLLAVRGNMFEICPCGDHPSQNVGVPESPKCCIESKVAAITLGKSPSGVRDIGGDCVIEEMRMKIDSIQRKSMIQGVEIDRLTRSSMERQSINEKLHKNLEKERVKMDEQQTVISGLTQTIEQLKKICDYSESPKTSFSLQRVVGWLASSKEKENNHKEIDQLKLSNDGLRLENIELRKHFQTSKDEVFSLGEMMKKYEEIVLCEKEAREHLTTSLSAKTNEFAALEKECRFVQRVAAFQSCEHLSSSFPQTASISDMVKVLEGDLAGLLLEFVAPFHISSGTDDVSSMLSKETASMLHHCSCVCQSQFHTVITEFQKSSSSRTVCQNLWKELFPVELIALREVEIFTESQPLNSVWRYSCKNSNEFKDLLKSCLAHMFRLEACSLLSNVDVKLLPFCSESVCFDRTIHKSIGTNVRNGVECFMVFPSLMCNTGLISEALVVARHHKF